MKGSALRSEDCRAVSLRCFIALRLQSYSGLKGGGCRADYKNRE